MSVHNYVSSQSPEFSNRYCSILTDTTMTVIAELLTHVLPPSVAMILGFGERRQTVSEADAPPGHEFFDLVLFITSLRTSELNYPVGVRSVIRGQPIIEPSGSIVNPRFDGVFGIREANTITNLVVIENLRFNTSVLPALRVTIRDDYFLEEEECFELSIFPVNTEEMTERFMCNTAGDSFLCQHVICITDEDG